MNFTGLERPVDQAGEIMDHTPVRDKIARYVGAAKLEGLDTIILDHNPKVWSKLRLINNPATIQGIVQKHLSSDGRLASDDRSSAAHSLRRSNSTIFLSEYLRRSGGHQLTSNSRSFTDDIAVRAKAPDEGSVRRADDKDRAETARPIAKEHQKKFGVRKRPMKFSRGSSKLDGRIRRSRWDGSTYKILLAAELHHLLGTEEISKLEMSVRLGATKQDAPIAAPAVDRANTSVISSSRVEHVMYPPDIVTSEKSALAVEAPQTGVRSVSSRPTNNKIGPLSSKAPRVVIAGLIVTGAISLSGAIIYAVFVNLNKADQMSIEIARKSARLKRLQTINEDYIFGHNNGGLLIPESPSL